MDRAIDQYLQRHAEPEAQQFSASNHPALSNKQRYQHVLIIPAFAESAYFLSNVLSRCGNPTLLTIVVVNAPDDETIEIEKIAQRASYSRA